MYEIERAKIGISLYEKASNVDIFICESVAIKWYFSIRKSENWHFAKEVEKLVNLSKIFKTKATDQSTLCPKIETELCRERVVLNLTEWLPFLAKMQKVQGKIRCNNPFSPPPPPHLLHVNDGRIARYSHNHSPSMLGTKLVERHSVDHLGLFHALTQNKNNCFSAC